MEQIAIKIDTIEDVRREIDNCQRKAMKSVVELGYILRKADDAGVYKEQGYTSIYKFAKQEYGWSQSQTSRFMDINREFSEGGYSTVLKERYKRFGQAKLAEMLTLPENVREELDPDMKRDDIREIKSQVREAAEKEKEGTFEAAVFSGQDSGGMKMAVEKLFSLPEMADKLPALYPHMKKASEGKTIQDEDIRMAISSTGFGTMRSGGTMFFWKKDAVTVIKGDQKTTFSYREMIDILNGLRDSEYLSLEEWYKCVYGKDISRKEPEKEVQETVPEKKTREKKEKTASHIETSTNTEDSEEREPELEGQETIEKHAEKMPVEAVDKNEEPEETSAEEEKPVSYIETSTNEGGLEGCLYCSGEEVMESNDRRFRIRLTTKGLARISSKEEFAIMEFDFCPKCGKELESED